jgi:hypothetical protein
LRKTIDETKPDASSVSAVTVGESSTGVQLVSADGKASTQTTSSGLVDQIQVHFSSATDRAPLFQINLEPGASPELKKAACEALVASRPRRGASNGVAPSSLFYAPTAYAAVQ